MKPEHSNEPDEWLEKAAHELDAAEKLFQQDGFPDTISVHCHQTAEKALKAALLSFSADFPFIHDLTILLQLCTEKNNSFSEIEDLVIALAPLYIQQRYPFMEQEPYSDEEIEYFLMAARQVYEFVKKCK